MLRGGDEGGRYVHVHPALGAGDAPRPGERGEDGRLALAHAAATAATRSTRLARANAVRLQYLGLAPMGRDLNGDAGLGAVIDLLKE